MYSQTLHINFKEYDTKRFQCLFTRDTGAKGHKGNGVDAVLEVDEATQVSSHVTDNGC